MTARRSFLYLASALVTGTLGFGLLLAGWLAVGLLAVTPLVAPAAVGFRRGVGALASLEAALARRLLGVDLPPQRVSSGGRGWWGRGRAVALDGSFWRQHSFVALRTFAGWPVAVGAVSLVGSALYLVALPVYYRWVDLRIGSWHVDTLQRALLGVPAGVAALGVSVLAVRGLAALWRRAAVGVLGGGEGVGRARRLLLAHAATAAVADVAVLVVWAATGGPFWPGWVLAATTLPLALHAWALVARRRHVRALGFVAGVLALIEAFVVVQWALAGGGTFWPAWPALGFAVALAALALATWQRGPLERRIGELETTRAGAVDVQESELRRIERDLHDGAQARLVALGMSLGLAEQRLAADPETARDLVAEARVGVEAALRELRDLARGVHPPVLADRGLEAAVRSLAHASAVPVTIDADVPERPPAVVETAAYFVVAEALANAGKHAGANRVDVRIRREPTRLVVEVRDDGRGGADADGSGLTGLRQRVAALDGTLSVDSPSDGGTTLRAELPCAS